MKFSKRNETSIFYSKLPASQPLQQSFANFENRFFCLDTNWHFWWNFLQKKWNMKHACTSTTQTNFVRCKFWIENLVSGYKLTCNHYFQLQKVDSKLNQVVTKLYFKANLAEQNKCLPHIGNWTQFSIVLWRKNSTTQANGQVRQLKANPKALKQYQIRWQCDWKPIPCKALKQCQMSLEKLVYNQILKQMEKI